MGQIFCDSENRGGFKTVKFSHFGTPNGSNLAILRKFKGSGRGDSKPLNLANFGTPNGSNLATLTKFKVQIGEDSKPSNLATLAPQMAQI